MECVEEVNGTKVVQLDLQKQQLASILAAANGLKQLIQESKEVASSWPQLGFNAKQIFDEVASLSEYTHFLDVSTINLVLLKISKQTASYPNGSLSSGYFGILPMEIKLHIFSFLDVASVGRIASVCKEWNKLTKEDEQLWQHLVLRDFPSSYELKPDHRTWKWLYESFHVPKAP